MGMKKVALFLILLSINNISIRGNSSSVEVSPFCNPNEPVRKLITDADKVLCTEWVNGSNTWEGAMTNAIKSLVEAAKALKPKAMSAIQGQINLFLEPAWVSEPWLGNCSKGFDAYMENEEHWLQLVRSGRDMNLSAAFQVDHFATCKTMIKKGYPVPEIEDFDVHKSLRKITLAIISSKMHGHGSSETAVKDESNNSSRFCAGVDKEKNRVICQQWVYGARDWVEAVAKGMTAVIEIANSTKPIALNTIRARLAQLGVDPEPVVATCSQAFDAYMGTKSSHIGQVAADPLEDLANSPSDDEIAPCINELLDQANFSLPDINKFSKENSINRILSSIVNSRAVIIGDAGYGSAPGSFVLDGPGPIN